MKKFLTLSLLFLSALLGGNKVMAGEASFTFTSKWQSNSQTVNPITVTFGGTTSDQTGYRRFKNSATMAVSAETGYNVTAVTITFTEANSKKIPTTAQITVNPTGTSYSNPNSGNTLSWTGSASSLTFTKDNTGDEFDIIGISVTYEAASQTEWSYNIAIEDLRLPHLTYGPSRSGIYGLNINASGWQSYSTGDAYGLILTSGSGNKDITITNNSNNITKVVLAGAEGAFANTTIASENTYPTTKQDQIVWQSTTPATSVTISISATDRPTFQNIYVFTNSALSTTKQDVTLSFTPYEGTAKGGVTDYSIDGRVKATIGTGGTAEPFRPDDFSVEGAATFNQFHLSSGAVGVNTSSSGGSATIKAAFDGTNNPFYNTASQGTYKLTVEADANLKSKTISINDMRISKIANSNGLTADYNNLDRTLGGFAFTFTGGEGIKFNNGDGIYLRTYDNASGTITITPQKTDNNKAVKIKQVDIVTHPSYTNGTITYTNQSTAQPVQGVSAYSMQLNDGTDVFTMTSASGDIYIEGFTIYYTDADNTLNDAPTTPTFSWSKTSDTNVDANSYASPTLNTDAQFKNFDINITSNNTTVATIKSNDRNNPPLVLLQGATGDATITAASTASTYYNASESQVYTIGVTSTSSSKKWDFTTATASDFDLTSKWSNSGEVYLSKFTTSAAIKNSQDNYYKGFDTNEETSVFKNLWVGNYNKEMGAKAIRWSATDYLYFNNSTVDVSVPVAAGQSVIITFDTKDGKSGGFTFTNATVEGDADATEVSTSDGSKQTITLIATADGRVDFINKATNVRLHSIIVRSETRATLALRDKGSNTYEKNVGTGTESSNDNHFSHGVVFTPSDGAANPVTFANDASKFHITSSDPTVLDVSKAYVVENSFGTSSSFYFANVKPVGAGTATLTITFEGNNGYKPNSYTSREYTVYGPQSTFLVEADDQEIQRGQFSQITPIITDKEGNPLGIKQMTDGTNRYTTYILGEEDDMPDYTMYFDFTYTAAESGSGTNWSYIKVDNTGKITTEDDDTHVAEPGATRKITIAATPKSKYETAFASSTAVTNDLTVTIIEKTADVQLEFYWDENCTETNKVTDAQYDIESKQWIFNKGIFAKGFPNGRILYVKAKNEGNTIWFSYAQDADAAVIPANPSVDKKKRIFQYRRGIPIYIDDNLSGSNYICINAVEATYDASTKKYNLNGSVQRMKFPVIVAHDRPAEPTYDPVSPSATTSENKDGRKIMNTAQNVVAYGDGASKNVTGQKNIVYGKFSTSSVYTTEQLINEATVSRGIDNVPVVSTEVNTRRFTAVQIKTIANDDKYGYGDYISPQTYTEYYYLYDTDLRITPDQYNISIYNTGENPYKSGTPTYTVTWYNKKTGKNQEVDSYAGKITYSIASRNGASNATLDTSTGVVTAGNEPGWVRVKVTYAGGEKHGGVSGEPQYESETDKSEAYYYVYISDPSKETPIITPPTRNFTGTLTYKIQAPTNWAVRYTSGKTPNAPTKDSGTELAAKGSVTVTIGNDMNIGDTYTVKAIAYNGDLTSVVVSETYTKKAPLPDPIFDPDGTKEPGYVYNTNELTVQIACAYAGSVIYYTISDKDAAEKPDPVIGAENTYRYSGLSKITVTGEKTIKAIAYDPVNEIYSNIVTSNYVYSTEMSKPYFQVSDDGGNTWKGLKTEGASTLTEGGTKWYGGENITITPSTQIRIVDPNAVAGTIYYTLDNKTTPSNDANSFVYIEGYPFTVGKTTTAKAITTLEDASSDVASAVFTIETSKYGNVWEANQYTLTDSARVVKNQNVSYKGIHINDGFIISTISSLLTQNTETKVNTRSLATGNTAHITYAQADITATFGGYDLASWEEMEIADKATGTPIGNIGEYSIKTINNTGVGNGNARDENNKNYNHIYAYKTDADKAKTENITPATTHEKTFKIPAIGDFVRFEPEKDGDLTIWCLQQGALLYEDDKYFIPNVLRIRPVYLVDEQGKSYQVKTVNGVPQLWSSARLSENWTKIQATAAVGNWMDSHLDKAGTDMEDNDAYAQYLRYSDGVLFPNKPGDYDENKSSYKRLLNKGPNRTETAAIYNLYKADLDKNHVNVGDPIKPFALHTGSNLSLNAGMYVDNSDDGTGYVLASGGYAKYTFEVKAGKTYYFFAQGSKIGIRGFQFVPTETGSRTTLDIEADGTNEIDYGTTNTEKPIDVTLKRAFTAKQWAALVLPFSVSQTQLAKAFGDGVDVLHFDDITNNGGNIHLVRHWYKMLVAGTPVLIRPTKNISEAGVTFEGVRIETKEVETITGKDDSYSFMGTFQYNAKGIRKYDYYINGKGNFSQWKKNDDTAIKATRAWLRPKSAEIGAAKQLTTDFSDFFNEGTITGIISIENDENSKGMTAYDGKIYDIKGQIVSLDGDTSKLPKGIYISNGKKFVIK